jgi:hypothetical protein
MNVGVFSSIALRVGVLSLVFCADIPRAFAQKADVSDCLSARRQFKRLNRPLLILNHEDADRFDSLGAKNYADALRIGTNSLETYLTTTTLEQLNAGRDANELTTFLSCMQGDEHDLPGSDYTNTRQPLSPSRLGLKSQSPECSSCVVRWESPIRNHFSSVSPSRTTSGRLSARWETTTEVRLSSSIPSDRRSKAKCGFY